VPSEWENTVTSTDDKIAKIRSKYEIPKGTSIAPGTNGYATFDGHFVSLVRVGLSRLTIGKGAKRIAVTSITGVQIKQAGALVNGFIQFTVPGGNERRSAFGQQTVNAAQDENSVVFVKTDEPAFLRLRDVIEAAQLQLARPPSGISPQTSGTDVIAQLQQLGQLREAGILTDDEFASKKAELLSRL
jgi:hypothetical protein